MKTIEVKLLKNPVTRVVPPKIESLMCGALYADIYSSGYVRLTYQDNTTEGANLTVAQLAAGRANFFSLVSAVQSFRPDTLKYP